MFCLAVFVAIDSCYSPFGRPMYSFDVTWAQVWRFIRSLQEQAKCPLEILSDGGLLHVGLG